MANPTAINCSLLVKYVHSASLSTLPLSHRMSGWFKGLSSTFLAARTARILVLAGTDRLDNELMIGQMQGKFQMVVIPGVGHMLQEVPSFQLLMIQLNSCKTHSGRSHKTCRDPGGVLETQRTRCNRC